MKCNNLQSTIITSLQSERVINIYTLKHYFFTHDRETKFIDQVVYLTLATLLMGSEL